MRQIRTCAPPPTSVTRNCVARARPHPDRPRADKPGRPRHRTARSQGGAIAQSGERLHGMQEVVGSIPTSSTIHLVRTWTVPPRVRLRAVSVRERRGLPGAWVSIARRSAPEPLRSSSSLHAFHTCHDGGRGGPKETGPVARCRPTVRPHTDARLLQACASPHPVRSLFKPGPPACAAPPSHAIGRARVPWRQSTLAAARQAQRPQCRGRAKRARASAAPIEASGLRRVPDH